MYIFERTGKYVHFCTNVEIYTNKEKQVQTAEKLHKLFEILNDTAKV